MAESFEGLVFLFSLFLSVETIPGLWFSLVPLSGIPGCPTGSPHKLRAFLCDLSLGGGKTGLLRLLVFLLMGLYLLGLFLGKGF